MLFQLGVLEKVYLLGLLSCGIEIFGCLCPPDFKKTNDVCIRVYEEQEAARDAAELCELEGPSGKLAIINSTILAEFSSTNSSFSLDEYHVYHTGPFPPCGAFCYGIQYNGTQSAWHVVGISCGSVFQFICQTEFLDENPPDINSSSVQYQLSSFSITVQWQEPLAGDFTGFHLVAENINGTMVTKDLDDVTTNATLGGLCGGIEYTFYLYSVNGNTLGQPITFTNYTNPSPVECVNVTHSKNHVTFTWFPVKGAVTFYEAFLLEVDKMKLKSKGVLSEEMELMDLRLSKGSINSKRHDLVIETVLVLASEEKKSQYRLPLNPDDTLIEESYCNVTTSSSSSSSACGPVMVPDEAITSRYHSSPASPRFPSLENYLTMSATTTNYLTTPKRTSSTSSPTEKGGMPSTPINYLATQQQTTSKSPTGEGGMSSTKHYVTTSQQATSTSPHTEEGHGMSLATNSYLSTPQQTTSLSSPTQEDSTKMVGMTSTNNIQTTSTPSTEEEASPSSRGSHSTTTSTIASEIFTPTTMAIDDSFVATTTVEISTLAESSKSKLPGTQTALVGTTRPTITSHKTTDLRTTQAEATLTYHSKQTSENLVDPDPMTTLDMSPTTPEDDNPFANCSFSAQLGSPSENLTTAATRYIQHVLSGILPSDSPTTKSNSTVVQSQVEDCYLPDKTEGAITIDVLAGYLTDELLRLTSEDLIIDVGDQPGIKDFKLILNPTASSTEKKESLKVEFKSEIEIEIPFSTLNQSDCCKAVLLYEEDEDFMTYPSFNNYCTNNDNKSCFLAPRAYHIATVSLYPPPPSLFLEPIRLQFNRQLSVTTDPQAQLDVVPTCAWLDEELSTETKLVWNTENIITERPSDSEPSTGRDVKVIKCLSYHLTSFSVIMRPATLEVTENHYRALSIISRIGSIITILSAVITIGVFIILGILQHQRIVHSNLIAAVGLSQLVFIVGIDKVQNNVFCNLVSVFLFYSLMATFCWMLMEAAYLYVSVVQVFARELKVMRYTLFGWGFPLLIVGATVSSSFHHLTSDLYCWLPVNENKIWAFIIPSVFIILINLILLFGVLYEINKMVERNITDVKISRTRTTAKALLLMLPLVGTPWIFALFAFNSNLVIFDYLFNIFNSFQGLWIFLLHIVGNKEVRTRLRAKVSPQSTRNEWATQSTNSQAPSENLPMAKMGSP